jgi:GT2 family glycosyltransferase
MASGRNAAAELAIKSFDPTHLLFIDNDMIVTPHFVHALLEPFQHDNRLGQTQAKLRLLNDPPKIKRCGRMPHLILAESDPACGLWRNQPWPV